MVLLSLALAAIPKDPWPCHLLSFSTSSNSYCQDVLLSDCWSSMNICTESHEYKVSILLYKVLCTSAVNHDSTSVMPTYKSSFLPKTLLNKTFTVGFLAESVHHIPSKITPCCTMNSTSTPHSCHLIMGYCFIFDSQYITSRSKHSTCQGYCVISVLIDWRMYFYMLQK